jgi:type IV pilus assembly protein PilN
MRYDINLATRPYIDARRFYAGWAMVLVPLLLLAVMLGGYAIRGLVRSREVAKKVREQSARIAALDRNRAIAEEVMSRPENRDTRDKSRFLNAVIARKAFSWTQVFEELERVMPDRVRVLAIHPEIKDNRVLLVMSVAGESRADAVELLRHMEGSQSFRQPQLRSEDVTRNPNEGNLVRFEVAAVYVPRPALAATTTAKGGD